MAAWEHSSPSTRSYGFTQGLRLYLGAQQMQAPVAWRPKASCSPFDQAGKYEGEPPLPRDANARQDFCSLFTCGDKQEEAQARGTP